MIWISPWCYLNIRVQKYFSVSRKCGQAAPHMGMPGFKSSIHSQFYLPTNAQLWQVLAPVVGFLPSMRGAWTEF